MTVAEFVPGRTLGDYLSVARRHGWLILTGLLAGVAGGIGYSLLMPPVYVAQASVLVQPTGLEDTALAKGRTKTEINLDTEAQLVTSTEVALLAAKDLTGRQDPLTLASQVAVKVPANTSVLDIGFAAESPAVAQAGADAFALAYLHHRTESAGSRLSEQAAASQDELNGLREQRDELADKLAGVPKSDSRYKAYDTARDALNEEIAELASHDSQLRAAAKSVGSGRVVSKANLPTEADSPHFLINLASGALLGLLVGACLAVARQRFALRVWHPADLPRRCGVEVLAAVSPRIGQRTDRLFGGFGPAGRVFGNLRNEVVAALAGPCRIVVVAGVAPGSVSTVVSANLAAALAAAGNPTIVVATHPSGPVRLAPLLGVDPVPGLSDVFAKRSALPEVIRTACRPRLEVVGPGGDAADCGLSRDGIDELYDTLRRRYSYVVIDAAPMSVSADAQQLAADADAIILAVECGRDRVEEVGEAVRAVGRIGTALLGAVVLPRAQVPETAPPDETTAPEKPEKPRKPSSNRRRAPRPRRTNRKNDSPTAAVPAVDDPSAAAAADDR